MRSSRDTVLLVSRESRFMLGAGNSDDLVLEAVAAKLAAQGLIPLFGETSRGWNAIGRLQGVLSMSQDDVVLGELCRLAAQVPVLNSPRAVVSTRRWQSHRILEGTPYAMVDSWLGRSSVDPGFAAGLWVKSVDHHRLHDEDVSFAGTRHEIRASIAGMKARGHEYVMFQAHANGVHVKFYGVGNEFFWTSAGEAQDRIREKCQGAARLLGLDIFGGDVILSSGGDVQLVDLNDWPSFAPCRLDAAVAIATLVANSGCRGEQIGD